MIQIKCFFLFYSSLVLCKKTASSYSCNYKLQQMYGTLSKFNNISVSRMGAKSLLLCLFQFVAGFLNFVGAYPMPNGEFLSSYVDCSQVGSPNVSLSVFFTIPSLISTC